MAKEKASRRGASRGNVELPASASVVIVGGGIIGCAVARELTRYTPDVVVLEKESDVACGASKANNAEIHSGIGEDAGTLKQKLNVRGNRMYDDFVRGLGVDFKRQGLLIVVTPRSVPEEAHRNLSAEELREMLAVKIPQGIVAYGEKAGIKGLRILSREEVLEMEPNVTQEAVAGVFDPNYGLVCPYKLTIALAESAVAITQRRAVLPESVRPGFWARLISRFPAKHGSLATPPAMQLAIQEAGLPRILLGCLAAAVGKLIGRKGYFYLVAGRELALIDDIAGTMWPYERHIVLGPKEPGKIVAAIKRACGAEAVIADVNDIKCVDILAATSKEAARAAGEALVDNPFGNDDQQTPVVVFVSEKNIVLFQEKDEDVNAPGPEQDPSF